MRTDLLGLICQDCGKIAPRRGKNQKYCSACSEQRDRIRQNAWAKAHPASRERERAWKANSVLRIEQTGMEINAITSRRSLADSTRFVPDAGWAIKFAFPHSKAASKNHIWSLGGRGHVFKRQSTRKYQNDLAMIVADAVHGRKVFQNKIWIDLFVQKPDHKSDAINVVDVVCDAIKIGLGIDDRWFCIRQLDWEITKADPQIYITIYQRDTFDAQVCSCCGRIRPFSDFTKSLNSTNKNKIARICAGCRTGTFEDDYGKSITILPAKRKQENGNALDGRENRAVEEVVR